MKQLKIHVGICALAVCLQVQPMHSKIDFSEFTLEQFRNYDISKLSSEGIDDFNLAFEQAIANQATSPSIPATPIPSSSDVAIPFLNLTSPRRTPSNPALTEQVDVAQALACKKQSSARAHSAPSSPRSSPAPAASYTVQYSTAESTGNPRSPTDSATTSGSVSPNFEFEDAAPLQPANNLPAQRPPSPIKKVVLNETPGYAPAYPEGSHLRPAVNRDGTNASPRGVQTPEDQWRSHPAHEAPQDPEPSHGSKLPTLLQVAGISLAVWTTAEIVLAYKNVSNQEDSESLSVSKKARLVAATAASSMWSRPRQLVNHLHVLLKNIVEEK